MLIPFRATAYNYRIRSTEGMLGYVSNRDGKYVFTPLTYPDFHTALQMAKHLNNRTVYSHSIVSVKKQSVVNGKRGGTDNRTLGKVSGRLPAGLGEDEKMVKIKRDHEVRERLGLGEYAARMREEEEEGVEVEDCF